MEFPRGARFTPPKRPASKNGDNRAQQAIAVRELDATAHHPLQHNQLMTKRHVLRRKSVL
jgi:hypothetical protein